MNEKMECERLLLRPLSIKELRQIRNRKQNLVAESVLTEIVNNAIEQKISRMEKMPKEVYPWLTYWLITEKNSGLGIGLIGSKSLPDEEGYVEIGYAVGREYRRKGYMTEALEGFLDWLYQCSFCNGAVLCIRSANFPSIKVAEKCDFRYEKMQDVYRVYRYSF